MKILCTDLDNTIIYSYKHDIGDDKKNVEIYQGREISFITNHTFSLLQAVKQQYLIVPTTTRTIEQYQRIDLGIGKFPYALVCNGGVLLKNGEKDEVWYGESKKLIQESMEDLEKAMTILEKDERRKFELRFIEELFVFTKCNIPEAVVAHLKQELKSALVDVFHNGEKVYVVPVSLRKGMAVKRIRAYLKNDGIVAAGDSEFDVSMVEEADIGMVPYGLKQVFSMKDTVMEMEKNRIFSEAMLEKCIEKIS
ncbi:MAG: HAD hydrolase family protein [Lachnospiraceae bacterium]|nr:HAD hydrolase family protein [Lachnospiraceae bacterium]